MADGNAGAPCSVKSPFARHPGAKPSPLSLIASDTPDPAGRRSGLGRAPHIVSRKPEPSKRAISPRALNSPVAPRLPALLNRVQSPGLGRTHHRHPAPPPSEASRPQPRSRYHQTSPQSRPSALPRWTTPMGSRTAAATTGWRDPVGPRRGSAYIAPNSLERFGLSPHGNPGRSR